MQNWVLCLSLGWVSLPGSHAPSWSSQQAVGKAGSQGSPAFCPHEQTSTIRSTKTTERERCLEWGISSLAAKRLGKPPASLLSLPCSSMPQGAAPFWWYWWDWDGLTDVTRVSKKLEHLFSYSVLQDSNLQQHKYGTGGRQHWAQDWLFRAGETASLMAKLT